MFVCSDAPSHLETAALHVGFSLARLCGRGHERLAERLLTGMTAVKTAATPGVFSRGLGKQGNLINSRLRDEAKGHMVRARKFRRAHLEVPHTPNPKPCTPLQDKKPIPVFEGRLERSEVAGASHSGTEALHVGCSRSSGRRHERSKELRLVGVRLSANGGWSLAIW